MIFIFLDGVGIGAADTSNPFFAARAEYLPFWLNPGRLPDGTPIIGIDPLLGVAGIPQSATGQTSLFTGENIPRLLGRHFGSYPNRIMRQILKSKNLLADLITAGYKAVYINAYPVYSHYFSTPQLSIDEQGELIFPPQFPRQFKRRISVTTCMLLITGQAPFNETHLREESALFQDYSNQYLIQRGMDIPQFSPEKAAEILHRASQKYDFLLYEYFLTDYYGHRHDFSQQVQLIEGLNRMIGRLIALMNPHKETLFITSDHGNLEDTSVQSHTLNPVPLLVWGAGSSELRNHIRQISDVTPQILEFFSRNSSSGN